MIRTILSMYILYKFKPSRANNDILKAAQSRAYRQIIERRGEKKRGETYLLPVPAECGQ